MCWRRLLDSHLLSVSPLPRCSYQTVCPITQAHSHFPSIVPPTLVAQAINSLGNRCRKTSCPRSKYRKKIEVEIILVNLRIVCKIQSRCVFWYHLFCDIIYILVRPCNPMIVFNNIWHSSNLWYAGLLHRGHLLKCSLAGRTVAHFSGYMDIQ